MQNKGLSRIIGAYRGTPVIALQNEAGIPPFELRQHEVWKYAALRLKGKLNPANPLGERLQKLTTIGAGLGKMVEWMEITIGEEKFRYWRKRPPWKKPKLKSVERFRKKNCELRRTIREELVTEWEAAFSSNEAGRHYRQVGCTFYPTKKANPLSHFMKAGSRHTLSMAVQLRTGFGAFGAYFYKINNNTQSWECSCGEFETVEHILLQCADYEDQRAKYFNSLPDLSLRTLLNTKEGLMAVADFWDSIPRQSH